MTKSSLAVGGREKWMRLVADRPARLKWAGLCVHARATNEDGAESSQDFTPSERRFANFCHRKNDMIAGKCGRRSEHGGHDGTREQRL